MVTEQERNLARTMDREVSVPLRRGVQFAALMAARIQRAVNRAIRNREPIHEAILAEFEAAAVSLRDTMVVAYLLGLRRTRIIAPTTLAFAKTPHTEALAFLQKRLDMSPDQLANVAEFYEASTLRVMRTASASVERALQKTMIQATKDGVHVREGVRRLGETLAKQGITPANSYQLEAMYRTQTQLAYSAGIFAQEQDPDIQEILWGYKYVTVGDTRVRDSHVGLDGVTLPKDDAWWSSNRPPNGVGCRCQVIAIFEERESTKPPHQVDIDGRKVVQGADPGFQFNPGTVFNPLEKATYQSWLEKNAAGQGTMKDKGVAKPRKFWEDKLAAYRQKKPGRTVIPQPKIAPKPAPSLVEPKIAVNTWKDSKSLSVVNEQLSRVTGADVTTSGFSNTIRLNLIGEDLIRIKEAFPKFAKALDGTAKAKKIKIVIQNRISKTGEAGWWDPGTRKMQLAIGDKDITRRLTLGKWTVEDTIQSTVSHEMAHVVETKLARGWKSVWNSQSSNYWSKNVGQYASSSSSELWAESFSAYTHPRYALAGKRLPKVIEEFMESAVGRHPNLRVAPEVKKLVGVRSKTVTRGSAPIKKTTFKEFTPVEETQFNKKVLKWENTLTGGEKEAIRKYTSTLEMADAVKKIQRGLKAKAIQGDPKIILKNLENAFANAPQFKGTVYRGMNNLDPSFVKKLAVEGHTFELNSFASSSRTKDVAAFFGRAFEATEGKMWVELKIKTSRGALLSNKVSSVVDLNEVILPKGARYRVTKVKRVKWVTGDGFEIEMEIVKVKKLVGVKPRAVTQGSVPIKKTTFKELTVAEKKAFDKRVVKWSQDLTTLERSSIREYTASIKGATDLRNVQKGSSRLSSAKKAVIQKKIDLMEDAFARAPQFKGTVHRGMSNLKTEFIDKLAVEGNVVEFNAFTSTSTASRVARDFGRSGTSLLDKKKSRGWVEYKIKVNKGARIPNDVSAVSGLDEVLLSKGSKFKVTKVTRESVLGVDGAVIEMEEIAKLRLSLCPKRRSRIGSPIRRA